jgi:multiple sugar transport system permease protein
MAVSHLEEARAVPSIRPGDSAAAVPQVSRRRRLESWLFLLPAVLFQISWGWYPLVMAFVISFTNARLRGSVSFTGLDSYNRIWNDPLAAHAFRVTAIYAGLSILLTFVLPILVAIMLMEMPRRVLRWMMLLWFIPLSTIASILVFRYMYNTDYGIFQWVTTEILHLPPQPFLNSSSQVNFWLVFPGLLFFGPGLIYMATLQSIPQSYFEAAEIEGAGFWRKIWTISIPRMRPVISMLLIFALIDSSQAFEQQRVLTDGGPGAASRTVVLYLYELIEQLRFADATVLGVYLFFVVMALVIIYRLFFNDDPGAPKRTWFRWRQPGQPASEQPELTGD